MALSFGRRHHATIGRVGPALSPVVGAGSSVGIAQCLYVIPYSTQGAEVVVPGCATPSQGPESWSCQTQGGQGCDIHLATDFVCR